MTETPDNQPVCESESTDRPVMPCGLPMRNRIQPQDADSCVGSGRKANAMTERFWSTSPSDCIA